MKLQTKFNLGITIVFLVLAIGIAVSSIIWINCNTIREAEQRVKLYIRSSWEIYNTKYIRIKAATEALAQKQVIIDLLQDPGNTELSNLNRSTLQTIREEQGIDILNVLDAQGKVLLRTRPPYNRGATLVNDSIVQSVISNRQSVHGTTIFPEARLEIEGEGLLEQCLDFGGEPRGMMVNVAVPVIIEGELIGIIQGGSLLNGAAEEVDQIRDAIFKNEQYKGKPLGTATIFMGDLRVSTNVLDEQGQRAVGTRVSQEVAEQVLEKGLSWTGRAWVVDTWYLSQYDPIRDPNGNVVGMLYVGELEQKYLDMRTQGVILLLSVILGGLIFSFLVFFILIRNILRPIQKLALATCTLSGGDLSYRVTVTTQDEIGHLAQSFNEMAEQLEKQRQEIERDHQALEALNQELRTTNRNYMEMLGFVAHELKNPLGSAIMSLHTVKDGYLGELNAAQERSLESVAVSLDYFSEMIRNYLDLSRLEKGELNVQKVHVALLTDVVEPVIEGLERGFEQREMILENHLDSQIELRADRDLLKIVYDNLLSNAIKYGREGGKVVLEAEEQEETLRLCVSNQGPGIPPEKMSMLFKKFSRLDNPEYAGKKGTGLGLFICREIVEKHGGEIWAESELGQWTRFIFTLPQ